MQDFRREGGKIILGLDEAGRGPLAGPVMAGAVILPSDFPFEILSDSKKLSEKKRLNAEEIIKEKAVWAVSSVDEKEIDRINILQASLKAMSLAFDMLLEKLPSFFPKEELHSIVDGNKVPSLNAGTVEAIVKADSKVYEVMAASILAKNERDRYMKKMDSLYPEYGYAKHKGYPTKVHREICRKLGPSPIQRLSFTY